MTTASPRLRLSDASGRASVDVAEIGRRASRPGSEIADRDRRRRGDHRRPRRCRPLAGGDAAPGHRNGSLPTPDLVRSKPQSGDPVWNAANCRNHRIFGDRTGLSAGRNVKPFPLQTYRRDMGGGNFVLMKDVSAPLTVKGGRWGGFRVGFKP